MTDCLKQLKDKGLKIYTTDLEDAIPVFDISFKGSVALVIGNEGNGVTEETKRFADKKIKIPMPGGLESLNASVATGICLYEAMKQRELDKY
jgi:TrmH family RNA methyltransferase